MTMYPFLTGFWTSAGVSAGILFLLIHWSHRNAGLHSLPTWIHPIVVSLIFLSPLLSIAYAWYRLKKRRYHHSIRRNRHRCFNGAIVGGIVIIAAAILILPILRT